MKFRKQQLEVLSVRRVSIRTALELIESFGLSRPIGEQDRLRAELRRIDREVELSIQSRRRMNQVDGPPLTDTEKELLNEANSKLVSQPIKTTSGKAVAGPSGLQVRTESVIMHAGPSGVQRAVEEREPSEWSSDDERWDAETVPNLTPGRDEDEGPSIETSPQRMSEDVWEPEDEIPLSMIRQQLRETKECTVLLHYIEFIEKINSKWNTGSKNAV